MKTYTVCKECNSEIIIKGRYRDRWELKKWKGDYIEVKCKKCLTRDKCNIEKVWAKHGILSLIVLIAVILLYPIIIIALIPFAGPMLGKFLFPVGILIVGLIYSTFYINENSKIKHFNSSRPNSLRSINFR